MIIDPIENFESMTIKHSGSDGWRPFSVDLLLANMRMIRCVRLFNDPYVDDDETTDDEHMQCYALTDNGKNIILYEKS